MGRVCVANEAAAERYAMQDAADDGIALGPTQRYARSLSTLYWHALYPDDLPSYHRWDCHTDGKLDLLGQPLAVGSPDGENRPRRADAAVLCLGLCTADVQPLHGG
jgi:hypothetical protein